MQMEMSGHSIKGRNTAWVGMEQSLSLQGTRELRAYLPPWETEGQTIMHWGSKEGSRLREKELNV